jgi:cellulose synthase/poly-beta-1,6-N-acetylglucosamine synthase-like glycosyltransferase
LADPEDSIVNSSPWYWLLLLPVLMLVISLTNLIFLRRPSLDSEIFTESVVVLLPVRNEQENIPQLIQSLKTQMGIRDLTFNFLDDNSSDQTVNLIEEHIVGDPRFTLTFGAQLPEDWLGKPFALQQAFEASDSQVVVVIDADVRLKADALVSAITLMRSRQFSFISAYPKQIAITWAERLIQPLLQWSWMSSVPLRIAERSHNPAFAVANGQFFIADRAALQAVGAFECVKMEIVDDIALARALLKNGFLGTVIDGSRIAMCRMYQSWPELREGYSKSLRVAFGSWVGSAFAITLLMLSGIAPLLLGLGGYAIIVANRAICARATGGRIVDALLHPLSILLLTYLIIRSWKMRGRTQWKGRLV